MAGENYLALLPAFPLSPVSSPFSFPAVKAGPLLEVGSFQCRESQVCPGLYVGWFRVCQDLAGWGEDVQEQVPKVGCCRARVIGLGLDS